MGITAILFGVSLLLPGEAFPAQQPSASVNSGAAAVVEGALHPGGGKVFLTKDEALKLAFKDCEVQRSTVYLTAEQRAQIDQLAGFKVKTKIVYTYVATKAGKTVGYAWFDVSKVRSKKQSVMFVIGANYKIKRFELLAFAEPLEYLPRANWYAQFVGKRLDNGLKLKKDIKTVTGATLTARATVKAARRVLAIQHILFPESPKTKQDPKHGSG